MRGYIILLYGDEIPVTKLLSTWAGQTVYYSIPPMPRLLPARMGGTGRLVTSVIPVTVTPRPHGRDNSVYLVMKALGGYSPPAWAGHHR